MGSPDEVDSLLALGSQRSPDVEACVDEGGIDDGDLMSYRRGTLSEGDREQVERHLVACPHCRDLVALIEVPRRGRRWPAVVVGAAASIAAVFLFVATPPPSEPIGNYEVADVDGPIASFRSAEGVGRRFNPNSQVEIKVEPKSGRAASIVRVFRVEEGVLVDVPASIKPGVKGVFLIEGSGRDLFGAVPGPKRLMIVVADEGADLSRIAGRTLIAAQALTTQAKWVRFDAEYQPE